MSRWLVGAAPSCCVRTPRSRKRLGDVPHEGDGPHDVRNRGAVHHPALRVKHGERPRSPVRARRLPHGRRRGCRRQLITFRHSGHASGVHRERVNRSGRINGDLVCQTSSLSGVVGRSASAAIERRVSVGEDAKPVRRHDREVVVRVSSADLDGTDAGDRHLRRPVREHYPARIRRVLRFPRVNLTETNLVRAGRTSWTRHDSRTAYREQLAESLDQADVGVGVTRPGRRSREVPPAATCRSADEPRTLP